MMEAMMVSLRHSAPISTLNFQRCSEFTSHSGAGKNFVAILQKSVSFSRLLPTRGVTKLRYQPIIFQNPRQRQYNCGLCQASSEGNHDQNDSTSAFGTSAENINIEATPQDAVLKAISEVSRADGRIAKTTNTVIGGTETYGDSWFELDRKVNTYPSFRSFTAIGTGGEDFVQSMVGAIESVLQTPIPEGCVRHRESAKGRYISVKIAPMEVESSAQVRAIYHAMKQDVRMKYFI